MKTLIIFYTKKPVSRLRRTIKNHLMSFEKISEDVQFVNLCYVSSRQFKNYNYDLIVFHYTLLSINFSDPNRLKDKAHNLSGLNGFKIAFPQDDYVYSAQLCEFFNDVGINHVFTLYNTPSDIKTVYKLSTLNEKNFTTVLPGYVNDDDKVYLSKLSKSKFNKIDISYRSRKNPPYLGKNSFVKWQIADEFKRKSKNLKVDISTSEKDSIEGLSWLDFLFSSKTVLGVEGGASINDQRGELKEKYLQNKDHELDFQIYHKKYLAAYEGNINLKCITPRIFEAILAKSCLILYEGNYSGILIPWKHFIPVKQDFSNIEIIIDRISDEKYCKKIASNAYRDIIESNKYDEEKFIKLVLSKIPKNSSKTHFTLNEKMNILFWKYFSSFFEYSYLIFKGFKDKLYGLKSN